MLRFFRHIRKKLIEESRVRQYVYYAVGEILLVMIGILIALQVNNWNEERKEQQFLEYAMIEVYEDLSRDMDLIYSGIEPRLQLRERSIHELLEMSMIDKAVSEDRFYQSYRGIDQGFTFSPIFGSYETLKQRGLDKIKVKELRKEIIDFYEYYLPRAVIFIHSDDKDRERKVTELEKGFNEFYVHVREDGSPAIYKRIKGTNFFENQAILEVIRIQYGATGSKRYRINAIKRRYNSLMNHLEEEFNSRSISYTAFDSTLVIPDF